MEISEYEKNSLKKTRKWEKEKHKGLHKKVLDATSRPVDYLVRKIGPEKLKKIETAVEKTVKNLLSASTYTVNPEELIKRAHAHGVIKKTSRNSRPVSSNCSMNATANT